LLERPERGGKERGPKEGSPSYRALSLDRLISIKIRPQRGHRGQKKGAGGKESSTKEKNQRISEESRVVSLPQPKESPSTMGKHAISLRLLQLKKNGVDKRENVG